MTPCQHGAFPIIEANPWKFISEVERGNVVVPKIVVDPVDDAPREHANGGTIYFRSIDEEMTEVMLGLLGVHAENSYWKIFRVWSRAWLATK